jgi:putative membrane protein
MPSPKPGAQSTPHATTAGAGADQAFVRTAAQGGVGEVQLAKLAQDHAKDERVKAYAAMLERDHSKANKELSDLADKKTIHLSASESAASKATAGRLQKLEGAAFDRAYIAEMVRDHQKDVAEFEKAGRTLSDADLKAFVQQTLPTLKEHLAKAQQLQKDVK